MTKKINHLRRQNPKICGRIRKWGANESAPTHALGEHCHAEVDFTLAATMTGNVNVTGSISAPVAATKPVVPVPVKKKPAAKAKSSAATSG